MISLQHGVNLSLKRALQLTKRSTPPPFLSQPSNEGQQVNVSLIAYTERQFYMLFVLNPVIF